MRVMLASRALLYIPRGGARVKVAPSPLPLHLAVAVWLVFALIVSIDNDTNRFCAAYGDTVLYSYGILTYICMDINAYFSIIVCEYVVQVHSHTHTHMCLCMYMYVCMYIHAFVCVCMCAHVCMHARYACTRTQESPQ